MLSTNHSLASKSTTINLEVAMSFFVSGLGAKEGAEESRSAEDSLED